MKFTVPAEIVTAACEASAKPSYGKPALSCVAFYNDRVYATDSYIALEGTRDTSQDTYKPEWLLFNAQELKDAKPKGSCLFQICEDGAILLTTGKPERTVILKSQIYTFPQQLPEMFKHDCQGSYEFTRWMCKSEVIQHAFKVASKLGKANFTFLNFDGEKKPMIVETNGCKILVMNVIEKKQR